MSFEITDLAALEILDSRGRPTVQTTITLSDGTTSVAGVPSGASTGTREAVELRDGDTTRFGGSGVLTAVANVNGEIADLLRGQKWQSLEAVDKAMAAADGTPTKARLGANATVGVSMALARALAASSGQPLHAWLPGFGQPARIPVPCFNVLNGGAHAPNALDFQEFMISPLGSPGIQEAVRAGAEVYAALRKRLTAAGHATGLGDEGGFAPELTEPEEVLEVIVAAITDAGYTAGRSGIAIALDPAASEFRDQDGIYHVSGQKLSSHDMIERYAAMIERYPIWSIEDGLGESDRDGWQEMTTRLGERVQLVGRAAGRVVRNPARDVGEDRVRSVDGFEVRQHLRAVVDPGDRVPVLHQVARHAPDSTPELEDRGSRRNGGLDDRRLFVAGDRQVHPYRATVRGYAAFGIGGHRRKRRFLIGSAGTSDVVPAWSSRSVNSARSRPRRRMNATS